MSDILELLCSEWVSIDMRWSGCTKLSELGLLSTCSCSVAICWLRKDTLLENSSFSVIDTTGFLAITLYLL